MGFCITSTNKLEAKIGDVFSVTSPSTCNLHKKVILAISKRKNEEKNGCLEGKSKNIVQVHLAFKHSNTPFQNSNNPHFQNKAKSKAFLVKMSFIFMGIKTNFHINIVAVSLALKQRLEATRKWAIHIGNF